MNKEKRTALDIYPARFNAVHLVFNLSTVTFFFEKEKIIYLMKFSKNVIR